MAGFITTQMAIYGQCVIIGGVCQYLKCFERMGVITNQKTKTCKSLFLNSPAVLFEPLQIKLKASFLA